MGRHNSGDPNEEYAENPWMSGVITGIMVALVFVVTFVLVLRTCS